MNRSAVLAWLSARRRPPRRHALRCVFYYEFLGLGGVETVLLNRLGALRSSGMDAEFWFSRFWCDGAAYLTSADGIRRIARDEVGQECAAAGVPTIVVIDNPPVLRNVLDHCPRANVFFETHVSEGANLEWFHSAILDHRLAGCLVPSEYNAQLLEKSGFRDRGRIHVVRNGLDLSLWSNGGAEPHAEPSRPSVVWIGRLEDGKDPVTAVRCAVACAVRVPDVRFVLIGDSDKHSETVADIVARSGAPATNIEFVPHVPYHRMPAIYAEAARSGGALLSTSLSESSPMTVLEAMASGCPVVASAVGGVRALISHNRNGCLFEPGNVEQAVEAIVTLHCNRHFRETVVARGREYVAAHHSVDASLESLRSLLCR